MLTSFLEVLREKKSEEIHMFDRFFDTDVNPCPRFLPTVVNGVIKLFAEELPYEKAKKMKETGEWDKILSEVMEQGEWQ